MCEHCEKEFGKYLEQAKQIALNIGEEFERKKIPIQAAGTAISYVMAGIGLSISQDAKDFDVLLDHTRILFLQNFYRKMGDDLKEKIHE